MRLSGLAMLLLGLTSLAGAAHAEGGISAPAPAEREPTFLGMDLPLRPGERLLPVGDGTCSVILFAPGAGQFEELSKQWEGADWIGACRLGLAHGSGYIHHPATDSYGPATMLYGVLVEPIETKSKALGSDGYSYERHQENFYSGSAFNDISSARLLSYTFDYWEQTQSLGEIARYWGWDSFVFYFHRNAAGELQMTSFMEYDAGFYCERALPAFLQAHVKEVKKACGKKKDYSKRLLVRREGPASQRYDLSPITWAKSCPIDKLNRLNDCGLLLTEAAGKDAALFNSMIAGDKATRRIAETEILARYAPLEQALEALRAASGSGSAHLGGAQ